MKLTLSLSLLIVWCAVTMFYLVPISYAQSSRSGGDAATDDDPLLQPLPPGISLRVFIHTPRVVAPNHLGTCIPTKNDAVPYFEFAPWHLPSTFTWKLSSSTVPPSLGTIVAVKSAIASSFETWTDAGVTTTFSDGDTKIKATRLDGTNAILWKSLRAGIIGETYVWYNTDGEVIEADTAFNNRYPWKIFDDPPNVYTDSTGSCSTQYDAYDLQDIATHEFGHWIGLGDILAAVDLTMYGYGGGGELKKRTLGTGDQYGVDCIYHDMNCPPQ